MAQDRRRQTVTIAAAAACVVLWQLGVLVQMVLALSGLAAAGSAFALLAGQSTVRSALGRLAFWLGRRLLG